jgi:hypothetical protein
MDLPNLLTAFRNNNCQKIYVKRLSPNDNSKNQVYLAGSFGILNILPISTIETVPAGNWENERFKAKIPFNWMNEDGTLCPAPRSQLILYPKYPEVRFSGFLAGCENAPSLLMTQRLAGRLFFMSVTSSGQVMAYVASPDSALAVEYNCLSITESFGVFSVIELEDPELNKRRLLEELRRIHDSGWITSKRLDRNGDILPCLSSNCGGYTLEAELGISPNGYSEPDFLGWELKQFRVNNFSLLRAAVITLMTPEPTGGIYVDEGLETFIRRYGYADLSGRADRINFGGRHFINKRDARTGLKLVISGFNVEECRIRNVDGMIALLDDDENVAASWSFGPMILHWNRKHNLACYVPSQSEKIPVQRYRYGDKVLLGEGTDFQLFLSEIATSNIYYDPGIKLENASAIPRTKRRSQFRIKSRNLSNVYNDMQVVDLFDL